MKAYLAYIMLGLLVLAGCRTQQTVQTESRKPGDKELSDYDKKKVTVLFIDAATKDAQDYQEEALNGFNEVLKLDPNHGASHYHIARILLKQQQTAEALPHAQAALENDSRNIHYYLLLADCYRQNGNGAQSVATLEDARKVFPGDIELIYDLGQEYLREQQLEQALALYDTILAKKGIDAEVIKQKKEIYLYLDQKDKAITEMQKLATFYPSVKEYQYELYDLYIETGNDDAAAVLLENLLEQDSQDAFALFRLIELAQKEGNEERADSLANVAFSRKGLDLSAKIQYLLRLDKDPTDSLEQKRVWRLLKKLEADYPESSMVLSYIGEKYLINEQPDSARVYMRKAVQKDDSNLNLWNQLIRVDLELQRWADLEEDTHDALEVYPNNIEILYWHAQGSYQNKSYSEAISSAKRFNKIANDRRNIEMMVLIGDCYNFLKDYASSDATYDKLLEKDPNNPTALNNYAYFLSVRGERLEDAEQMIEKAIKIRPNEASFQDTYGWVLYQNGKYEEAKVWIEKAYKAQPAGEVAEHLGDVYHKLGDMEKANEYWQKAKASGEYSDELDKKLAP